MPRTALLVLSSILIFTATAYGQDDRPLGDIARETRAANSSSSKSAKIVTNDDVPSGKAQGGGQLSQDKQAFCDELRKRKDPAAEQSCALLGMDMGPEYEDLSARYISEAQAVCAANHGQLPTTEPKDASLASQWRELMTLGAKYTEMMNAETKSQAAPTDPVTALQQEEGRELAANVPDLHNPTVLSRNPREMQRFHEIEDKYKSLITAQQQRPTQINLRAQRYVVDIGRIQRVCSSSL